MNINHIVFVLVDVMSQVFLHDKPYDRKALHFLSDYHDRFDAEAESILVNILQQEVK